MENYRTNQEAFWAGQFGDDYTDRSMGRQLLANKIAFFARALSRATRIQSCMEMGSNIGLNLKAIQQLIPDIKMCAVEINRKAADICSHIPNTEVFNGSIIDYNSDVKYDLTFTRGVLIHINPELLGDVYDKLYAYSSKYILVAEYYNPEPVEVPYRNHKEKLFKRDFAGELLDRFSDLRLVDYGFMYHRDTICPEDDISFFLMQKS